MMAERAQEIEQEIFSIVSGFSFVDLLDLSKACVGLQYRNPISQTKKQFCVKYKNHYKHAKNIIQIIDQNIIKIFDQCGKKTIIKQKFVQAIRDKQTELGIKSYRLNQPSFGILNRVVKWSKELFPPEIIQQPNKKPRHFKKKKREILLCPIEQRKIVSFKIGLKKTYYIAIPRDWFLLWKEPEEVCVEYKQDQYETAIFIRSDTELYNHNLVNVRKISATAYVPLDAEFLFDNGISDEISNLPRLKLEYDGDSMVLTLPPKLVEEGRKKVEILVAQKAKKKRYQQLF